MLAFVISLNVVTVSDKYADALGNIFGIIVLAELDTIALHLFQSYLDFFHASLV